jgi:V/A-type H+-transporting ATPase subunit I
MNLTSRKMKRVQMTVLRSDVNTVIEYLGRHKVMHFVISDSTSVNISSGADSVNKTNNAKSARGANTDDSKANSVSNNTVTNTNTVSSANTVKVSGNEELLRIKGLIEKLRSSCEFLGVELPAEPTQDSVLPGEAEEALCEKFCSAINALKQREITVRQEKLGVEEAYSEAKAFSNLNAPFSDLDQLSFLTLRVGRLDPKVQSELKQTLGERAVIIPLGGGASDGGEGNDRLLAASSRKGRFALDSELKKCSFKPIAIPEGYQGVPAELLEGLEGRLKNAEKELEEIENEKNKMRDESQPALYRLGSILLMGLAAEDIKSRLVSTSSVYILSGWIPADMINQTAADLSKATQGRTAIRIYVPDEIPEVQDGSEKVPVSMKHNKFVKGFEGVIFSYGAPLYGTIDPTPLVAIFFTLLFGIMFGDLGQGVVLLLLGIVVGKFRRLAGLKGYSTPLISVGIASMVMGLLTGEIFTSEELLVVPTRTITSAIASRPMDRILTLMPLAEKGGSVIKLFYFFGFTIGMGIILNSLGLLINIYNKYALKRYEEAFFAKTGLSGLLLFWYAIFIAVRCIFFHGRFEYFDMAGILIPCICIFFGPVIWRCIARERPLLKHGIMTFIMEGFVEVMETASGYISNTVSFLRVGAFALSHGVLSYIVFRFTEELANSGGPVGSISGLLVLIFGNLVIIVLEGMIVAIQVVRLQYYEFFSKFFTETGVEFAPFRFRKGE